MKRLPTIVINNGKKKSVCNAAIDTADYIDVDINADVHIYTYVCLYKISLEGYRTTTKISHFMGLKMYD